MRFYIVFINKKRKEQKLTIISELEIIISSLLISTFSKFSTVQCKMPYFDQSGE